MVKSSQFTIKPRLFLTIAALLLAVFTWLNYQYGSSATVDDDFYPFWTSTRLFLTEGASPYSPKTSREIQRSLYGHPARGDEDQKLFVYPYYAMLVFAPFTITGNYPLAHALWASALTVGVLLIGYAGMIMTGWQPTKVNLAIFFIFLLLWLHSAWPILRANTAILVALLVTLALLCLVYRQYHLTGILLALATIKPNMVLLVILFTLYWSLSHRQTLVAVYFSITLTLLVGVSLISQPDWIILYLRQLLSYLQTTPVNTPTAIFSMWWPSNGVRFGQIFSAVFALLMLREWISATRKGEHWFLWAIGVTITVTPLTGIPSFPIDYVLMLPVLVMLFSLWEQRWEQNGRWVSLAAMAILLIRPWWTYLAYSGQEILNEKLFFFTPLVLLIALYWMRYWTLKSHHIPIEISSSRYDL